MIAALAADRSAVQALHHYGNEQSTNLTAAASFTLSMVETAVPLSEDQVKPSFRCAAALRQVWREGYGWADLRSDLSAGIVVGIIALPLSMALAIASGTPPQHGLYTAIVAGALIA